MAYLFHCNCFSVQNSTHNLNKSDKNPVFVYFFEPKSKKNWVQAAAFTLSLHWESAFFVDFPNLIDYETCQIEYSAIIFESQVQWYHGRWGK